jgi:hypothetical protein
MKKERYLEEKLGGLAKTVNRASLTNVSPG